MNPKLFFSLLITSIIIIKVQSYDCEEFREHAIRKCKRHYGESIEICMHKRMKRSPCNSRNESRNTHCGECNCNYCSNNSCTSRCSTCCNREVHEEQEICQTSYCCHKMCHKKCYTPSCSRNCRSSCLKSLDTKENVVTSKTQQAANITTIINLQNKINNTNVIDMPVMINTTNYNNLNLTAPKGVELEAQKEDGCCEILIELCDPDDVKKCYREKQKYCGKECSNYDKQAKPYPEKSQQSSIGNVQPIQQNYPVLFPNYNNYPQIQNYPNYFQYPQINPQKYPQVFPQVYPQIYSQVYPQVYQQVNPQINQQVNPQNYNYFPQNFPSQIPRGCHQILTYPFVTCGGNNYPGSLTEIPNQSNQLSQNPANPTNNYYNPSNQFYPGNLPSSIITNYNPLQVPQMNGQDLPGQPRTPEVQPSENTNNNNDNNEADENAVDEDDDNEEDY